MHFNDLTSAIIVSAIEIHRRLGAGHLESVYLNVLAHELKKRGMHVE